MQLRGLLGRDQPDPDEVQRADEPVTDAEPASTASPDLVAPEALERVHRFATLAADSGVGRLVLLSGRGEKAAQQAEQAVMGAGTAWTIVRSAFFAQNFSEKGFEAFVRSGTVALPAPEIGEPFVDADDIADVVVAALTEDGHAGQVYEVTGPRLMSFADAVADIAAATGRAVAFERITADEFVDGLTANGVPAEEAHVFAEIFETVLDGRNAYLTDGVQRALGRPPRDFTEYAAATAPTGCLARHRRLTRDGDDGPTLHAEPAGHPDRMSDDDLIARFGSARHPGRPPGHPVPDGVTDETVAALGELSAAFEVIEEARGHLYAFHRRSGKADLALQEAVDHLRKAGHPELADEIDQVLVGRDVVPGLWTYQLVESYDRTYYDVWQAVVEKAERLGGGVPHLAESGMKVQEQSGG